MVLKTNSADFFTLMAMENHIINLNIETRLFLMSQNATRTYQVVLQVSFREEWRFSTQMLKTRNLRFIVFT